MKAVAITDGFTGSGMVVLVKSTGETVGILHTGITIEKARAMATEFNSNAQKLATLSNDYPWVKS